MGVLLGAAIGAGAGAIVGHQRGHAGSGTAIGAGIGALTGGLIGNALDGQDEEMEERSALAEARVAAAHEEVRQAEALSPLDVIRMSQAGVSDDLIIAKMDQAQAHYRLSAAEIIDLQLSGVSDRVIRRMLEAPPRPIAARQTARTPHPNRVYDECHTLFAPPKIHLRLGYRWAH